MTVGTITGFLIAASGENPKSFKESLMQGLLNGFFTAGLYAAIRHFFPEAESIAAVFVSAGLSAIGRNMLLQVASKWIK